MKEAILSAILAGSIGAGGTYAVTQHQPDAQATIQQARLEQAKLDSDAITKQLFDQLVESVQTQKAMLMVVRQGAIAEQNQVTLLDAHVQEITCLIKGCKPQAQR